MLVVTHLHVVVPDAVNDDALEGEGVGERGQVEQPLKADALVDLSHLLEQPDQRDLAQSGKVLLQQRHVLRVLDELERRLDPVAQLQWVEVDLKPLVEVLQRLGGRL